MFQTRRLVVAVDFVDQGPQRHEVWKKRRGNPRVAASSNVDIPETTGTSRKIWAKSLK